jgi:hypothetical protein
MGRCPAPPFQTHSKDCSMPEPTPEQTKSKKLAAYLLGRFSLWEYLERCILATALSSSIAALILVGRNGLPPFQRPYTFGLAFWMWFAILYGAAVFGALLAFWLPSQLRFTAWVTRLALAGGALWFVGNRLWFNRRAISALFDLAEPARFRWLAPTALILGIVGLLLLGFERAGRKRWFRLAALAAIGAHLGALWPVSRLRPSPDFLGGVTRFTAAPDERRFLVIGVDGADWAYMEPLLARGDLPNLAALRARGAWGRLKTVEPTSSPVIWTSIATGRPPGRHGIRGFTMPRLRGVEATLPPLRPPNGLGFPFLIHELERRGYVYEATVTSGTRKVPAFWVLAARAGSPVSVVSWWVTWPAEPVLGHVVSDHIHMWPLREGQPPPSPVGVTFPETLYQDIAPLVMRPDQMTLSQALPFMDISADEIEVLKAVPRDSVRDVRRDLKYFLSAFETSRRISAAVMEKDRIRFGAPSDHLVLFRLVDELCHTALHQSELVSEHLAADENEVERFGRAVSEAYRSVDRAIGELASRFGDGNIVVLSDHGFALEEYAWGLRYNHTHAPDGIVIAAGPAFRPGRVEGLSVYDIMPLLMAAKGLPVSQELDGRVPTEILRAEVLERTPVRHVRSYGLAGTFEVGEDAPQAEAELMERLRALGYIK